MTDSLLQRVAQNDDAAVRECIACYSGLVWSLARRFTRSNAEAEDAVQDVFLSLWRSAGRFDPAIASETTFVAMIARRRLIDRARSEQHRTQANSLTQQADPVATQPREDVSDDAALAARALAELPPEQQRVIRLSIFQGLTHQQISDITGVALGTVKTHIRRALLRVRDDLARRAGQEVAP